MRHAALAVLILAAPLAAMAQPAGSAADSSLPLRLHEADPADNADDLTPASGSRLAAQAAPELSVSTLTVIGAMAAGGVALKRRRLA